jgi:hypothetical protein
MAAERGDPALTITPAEGTMGRFICRVLGNRITWIVCLTILVLASLMTNVTPYPEERSVWRWKSWPPPPATLPRWLPAILVLAVYVGLTSWFDRRPARRRALPVLVFIAVAALLIQISLVYIHDPYFFTPYLYRTIGPHNGFWQIATGTDDVLRYLRDYPREMQAHPFVHTMTHPPGNVVYVWLWRQLFRALPALSHDVAHFFRLYNCADLQFVNLEDDQIASALGQMLVPLLGVLTVVPLYLLGKRLAGKHAGLRAAALAVVVPAFALFTMRWDQVYPLFLCLALYWLCLAHEERGAWHSAGFLFASGLTISAASFFSFGNLTILAPAILYRLAHLVSTRRSGRQRRVRETWVGWAAFALGCASVWLVYGIAFGNSFWDVFAASMQNHLSLERDYWTWVWLNLYEFSGFVGVPVAVLFVSTGWRAWRQALAGRFRNVPAARLLALAVCGALLAVNVAGVVRGEVARLWILWMPAACLVAVLGLEAARGQRLFRLALALLAFQALVFSLYLHVFAHGMLSYRPRRPETTRPPITHPLDVQLGDDVVLLGYDLQEDRVAPGDTLYLTLHWQALDRPDRPYTVFVHLVGSGGQMAGQQDRMPVDGTLPTTCWVPGEIVSDSYDVVVASGVSPGVYDLLAGMYTQPDLERLPVVGDRARAEQRLVWLRSVEVQP